MRGRFRRFIWSAPALLTVTVGTAASVAAAADVPVPSVPSPNVPSAPVPSIPPVPVPAVPQVTPPPTTSVTPAATAPTSAPASSPVLTAARSAVRKVGSQFFGSGATTTAGPRQQRPTPTPGEGGAGSPTSAPATLTGESPGVSHRARVERDRRLRRSVLSLNGCLDEVPPRERRVLDLRAGIGIGRTRSRAEVARLTKFSADGVRRLERRGLRQLKRLREQRACGAANTSSSSTAAALPLTTAAAGVGGAAADVTDPPGSNDGTVGQRQPSVNGHGGGSHGSKKNVARSPGAQVVPRFLLREVGQGSSSLVIVVGVVVLVLLVFVLAALRELRRGRINVGDYS